MRTNFIIFVYFLISLPVSSQSITVKDLIVQTACHDKECLSEFMKRFGFTLVEEEIGNSFTYTYCTDPSLDLRGSSLSLKKEKIAIFIKNPKKTVLSILSEDIVFQEKLMAEFNSLEFKWHANEAFIDEQEMQSYRSVHYSDIEIKISKTNILKYKAHEIYFFFVIRLHGI